jgi:cell division protein FtsX
MVQEDEPGAGRPGMDNPLPDSLVVIPQNTSCTDTLASDLKDARLKGVQLVKTLTGRV